MFMGYLFLSFARKYLWNENEGSFTNRSYSVLQNHMKPKHNAVA